MTKVAVAGAAGQMGKRILHAISQSPDIQLVGALEAPGHPLLGTDAGTQAGVAAFGVPISADLNQVLANADVLIDFTRPEASLRHLSGAVSRGRAVVIGTTGFMADQWEEIRRIAPSTRCVISPNMSVGVNLILRLLRDMAQALGDEYDIEIVEAHHRRKVDAPSGTALRMAEVMAGALGRELAEVGVFSRHGQVGPRTDREIGIQTIRGGDIVGEHTVIFAGVGERIEIVHRAHSRDNFARGALKAARWVVGQPPGLYDMQDVLGLRGRG